MKLSPRIIQAMEILQLPLMALQERIESEMESNPVLEIRDEAADEQAPREEEVEIGEQPLVVEDSKSASKDFERLSDFEDEYDSATFRGETSTRGAADDGGRDRKMDAMANTPAPQQSLDEYLMSQWAFVEAPDAIKAAGKLIINNIDDDGYLRISLEETAKQASPPLDTATMAEALKLVQTLEPIGVGARDLKECLLLQLQAEELAGRDVAMEKLLVERYLRDIEMNRLPAIAKRANKSIDQIKAALTNISHLNPRPGSLISPSTAAIITPDIFVSLDDDGEPVVSMSDGNTPQLYISKSYQKLAKDRQTQREARTFLQKNIRSAQWLIGAIQQRRETVRRVAQEVFLVQKDFLHNGPEALHPLPMMDIANKVHVHVATISRAVAGKYVQTPWGIFPLRMFFSGGTTTAEGTDMAWDAVKIKLKELVEAEDKAHPLDDDKLALELTKHGIKIARRTVAKYRDLLEIPPARKRKQF